MVLHQLWSPLLGTRRHGSEQPPRLRREGDQKIDRARGVETLRDRQQGGAGIAADRARRVEERAMNDELARLRARRDGAAAEAERIADRIDVFATPELRRQLDDASAAVDWYDRRIARLLQGSTATTT